MRHIIFLSLFYSRTFVVGYSLRYYFDVNNSYVQNKLRILLAPYRHKQWKRVSAEDAGSPIHDPNSEVRSGPRYRTLSPI